MNTKHTIIAATLLGILALAPSAEAVNAKVYLTGNGNLGARWETFNWNRNWDRIVAHNGSRNVIFYNRVSGRAKMFSRDLDGRFTGNLVRQYRWRASWDEIVVGNFGGRVQDQDLLFYERATGLVRVYEFRNDGSTVKLHNGNLSLPRHLTTLVGGWWGHGRDEIVTYDKVAGRLEFYQLDEDSGRLVKRMTRRGLQRRFDQLIPGRFGWDGLTDLVFYDQDTGLAKTYEVDRDYRTANIGVADNWPMGEHIVVVPGFFAGDSRTDVLIYDQQNLHHPPAGQRRGAFYRRDGQSFVRMGGNDNWRSSWTHIVPLPSRANPGGTDLLFYDGTYSIPIHPVRVHDVLPNGSRTMFANLFPRTVERWLEQANQVYGAAGIRFTWDGRIHLFGSNAVNRYDPWGGTPQATVDEATEYATKPWRRGKVVVFFRRFENAEVPDGENRPVLAGSGAASPGSDFVVMPGEAANGRILDGLLAHELGHYLGLPHTFDGGLNQSYPEPNAFGAGPVARRMASDAADRVLEDYIRDLDDPEDSDVDRSPGGAWSPIRDTSPDPGENFFKASLIDRCDDEPSGEVEVDLADGSTFTLQPDRHNVMGYGICTFTRLSPDQIRAIRKSLHSEGRSHLIDG